jgi:hypothetical protein
MKERERERESAEREREREREREKEREQRESEWDRQREREREREWVRETERQRERERERERQTDRQTDRQTERERQSDTREKLNSLRMERDDPPHAGSTGARQAKGCVSEKRVRGRRVTARWRHGDGTGAGAAWAPAQQGLRRGAAAAGRWSGPARVVSLHE